MAVAAGASALGLVSAMPSGPGSITEALIAEIAATVPAPVDTFLLTALQDAEALIAQHRRCRTSVLQLVDAVALATLQHLRAALPAVRLVQVIHITGPEALGQAQAAAPWVDALLFDSGNPALAVKQLGGTGRTHDWALSRRIRDAVAPLPVWLAGGLHAGNVAAAVAAVAPYGLDLCTGVRGDDRLDRDKLGAFFSSLTRATA
jgi:phosphoribosylanthranilate isomerase